MIASPRLSFKQFTRRFALPLWQWYLFGTVMLACVNFINLEVPQLAKQIVNGLASTQQNQDSSQEYQQTALMIIGLGLLIIITRGLSRIGIFWPGRRLESDTKSFYFDYILRLPEYFFGKHGMGDLISRLANDIGQLRAFYAFGLLQVLNVLFLTIMTVSQMVAVHLWLTILTLIPLLLTLVLTRLGMPRMHRYSRLNQEALGSLTNRVTEAFVNVHIIQANSAEACFLERTQHPNTDVYLSNIKLILVRTVIFPLTSCLAGISQLVILAYGGYEIVHQRLSVGDILSFNVYIGLLTFPLTAMGIILALYQRAKTAIQRLGEIEAEPAEGASSIASVSQPRSTTNIKKLLVVQGLQFSYPTATHVNHKGDDNKTYNKASHGSVEPFRLGPVDFNLEYGDRLGLFGAIGSGKSTLMNLLTRLYDPPSNSIFWHGLDILTLQPQDLRREIAYALQTVHLFSDTIRANLIFGLSDDTPLEQLADACDRAQILGEILALPQGWNTPIGEKGLRLSGGQKQRLALARLFLRNARLYLLDDTLSAVDHTTERKLIDEFNRLGQALIIASHRGSALRQCREILVLDRGQIIDRGSFDELVRRHPALGRDL